MPATSSPVEPTKEPREASKEGEKPKRSYSEAQKNARIANAAKAREAYLRKLELKKRLEETSKQLEAEKKGDATPVSEKEPKEEAETKTESVPAPVEEVVQEEKASEEVPENTEKTATVQTPIARELAPPVALKRKRFEDLMMPNARSRTVSFDVVKRFVPPPKKPRFSIDDLL